MSYGWGLLAAVDTAEFAEFACLPPHHLYRLRGHFDYMYIEIYLSKKNYSYSTTVSPLICSNWSTTPYGRPLRLALPLLMELLSDHMSNLDIVVFAGWQSKPLEVTLCAGKP